ncbi:glycoside hydrolase family 35 protein [Cellulomonas sp. Y8]|uniref:glycoside hydrolase family 35 protein n=1 Tax=Cellulomonas sp. Y8 TaxID=2591145 RepID=UPI003D72DF1F
MPTFEIGDTDFLLDGRPHQVVSGALHYFRVHPEQWADRIRKARLMGLNTIETYVAWNFHAPERGRFDLDGPRDLGRFLDLVAAEGMHAIVRPGPYICAEWDNGGLPAWLLADPEVGVRRHEPRYLAAIAQYYDQLLPLVAERQVTRGGPVIAVQVENEYGAYGDDHDYLRALIAMNRERGIEVPLLSCDQADDEMQARGSVPELHRTVTFGTRAKERLELLRRHQPTGPLMCMEFWDGWFDWWGQPHHVAPAEMNAQDLDDLLALGASVNLYMFHGGTNFGFTGGANDKHTYQPITTSYDYDAPLAEHGAVTAKWYAMREVISRYAPVPDELPADPAPAPELAVDLDRRVPFAAALPVLGEPAAWDHLPTTDELGHWTGFTLYRTPVTADDRALTLGEVRDRALVALDGEPVGVLSRTEHSRALALPARAGELTLLVEDQGRVNYGPRIGEPKGLIGPARTATRELTDWAVTPLRLDGVEPALADLLAAAPATEAGVPVAGPAFLRGTFDTVAGADHFLRTDGWGKGLVWVNGFLLGRYWSAGPTATLYVPGPLLRAAGNELVVLELHGAAEARVAFVPGPDLGSSEV